MKLSKTTLKPKTLSVVILSHPRTPALGKSGLSGLLDGFAKTIGHPVRIKRIITNWTIPPGKVYVALANETWVKKVQMTGKTGHKED